LPENYHAYDSLINRVADDRQIDRDLIRAQVFVESTMDADAESSAGAVGLLQVKPSTAGKTKEQLKDPKTNLEAGIDYLQDLQNGKLTNVVVCPSSFPPQKGPLDPIQAYEFALMAYNVGPGAATRESTPTPAMLRYLKKMQRAVKVSESQGWSPDPTIDGGP